MDGFITLVSCVQAVTSRTVPVPVPAGKNEVDEVSMPSSSKVLVVTPETSKTRLFRRPQPDVTSITSPLERPCAVAVQTAGLAFVTAVTVMFDPKVVATENSVPVGTAGIWCPFQ